MRGNHRARDTAIDHAWQAVEHAHWCERRIEQQIVATVMLRDPLNEACARLRAARKATAEARAAYVAAGGKKPAW